MMMYARRSLRCSVHVTETESGYIFRIRYEWYGVYRMYVKAWQRWTQSRIELMMSRLLFSEPDRSQKFGGYSGVNFSESAHLWYITGNDLK